MSRNHKTITITIPKELDSLIDRLAKESKNTTKPFTKSGFIALACEEYIGICMKILESRKKPEKGGKA